jgi:hypothetical protein
MRIRVREEVHMALGESTAVNRYETPHCNEHGDGKEIKKAAKQI